MPLSFKPIGIIHTPYKKYAPYQPVESDEKDFYVDVHEEYTEGLAKLEKFRYIYLLYYMDQVKKPLSMTVEPPWADGMQVGLFASRSPVRPNPVGLSIVRLLKIEGNRLHTTGLDVLDGTPLLDIKPYIRELDSKEDANYGWLDDLNDREHLILHIRGIPHDY
jgi:tRNA-Thr(GGU) m(6)t(6)A37 methyltransferase TsaA